MNRSIPFEKTELNAIDMIPAMFFGPDTPLRDTPVTPKENIAAMYYDRHPYWVPGGADSGMLRTPLYNDLLGRGGPGGITDAFGIQWEYVEQVHGSIVRPGTPLMADVNEWKEKVKFPDIDSWDWAAAAAEEKIDTRRSFQISFVNGFWFERLISFMDFLPAAMALIDEDQTDAIKELFEATTNFAMKLVDKFCVYWPALDGFNIHDDWGSQRSPFFSMDTAYDLFVPYMKALTDHIHSKGRFATLHSCGHNFTRVQCYIDGGFDSWDPQPMNDTHGLYDQFGDKIIVSVVPDPIDPNTASEDDMRQAARNYFDRFCQPGKPSTINYGGREMLTDVFFDELYEYSRKKYGSYA